MFFNSHPRAVPWAIIFCAFSAVFSGNGADGSLSIVDSESFTISLPFLYQLRFSATGKIASLLCLPVVNLVVVFIARDFVDGHGEGGFAGCLPDLLSEIAGEVE